MTYTIKKSRIPQWGYEITAKNFHNIAPTEESAVNYLKDRFGHDVQYRIIAPEKNSCNKQGEARK